MTKSTSRRERNKQDKQERIFAAAWQLFTTQGFEATTIKHIADQADVGVGTVMLHGQDKGTLLRQLFRQAIAQRIQLPSAEYQGDLADNILATFDHFLLFYQEHPDLSREFIRQLLGSLSKEEQQVDQAQINVLLKHFAHWIKQGQQLGHLRPEVEAELVAKTLFALYQSVLQGWLAGFFDFEEMRLQLQQLIKYQIEMLEIR